MKNKFNKELSKEFRSIRCKGKKPVSKSEWKRHYHMCRFHSYNYWERKANIAFVEGDQWEEWENFKFNSGKYGD